MLAAGSLSDRYGRRPALVIGLLGFAGTSLGGALADSAGELIAWRVGMGASAALIFPTTLSVISNAFPDRRQRAAALGGWGAVVGADPFVQLARADRDHLGLLRLLLGGVRNDDAPGRLLLLLDAADDDPVMERSEFHDNNLLSPGYSLVFTGSLGRGQHC